MTTVKFTANGAEFEADVIIKPFQDEEYLVYVEDIRCGGESLDPEEMAHLLATNPNLPHDLAQLGLIKKNKITVQ